MSVDPAIRRELCDLLGQLRDGQLDPRGLARLDAIVTADPSARRLYLAYAESPPRSIGPRTAGMASAEWYMTNRRQRSLSAAPLQRFTIRRSRCTIGQCSPT